MRRLKLSVKETKSTLADFELLQHPALVTHFGISLTKDLPKDRCDPKICRYPKPCLDSCRSPAQTQCPLWHWRQKSTFEKSIVEENLDISRCRDGLFSNDLVSSLWNPLSIVIHSNQLLTTAPKTSCLCSH